jgi:arylsulfatase B
VTRPTQFWTAISIAFALALFVLVPTAGANERPNVIIFVADDLGWADVGYHGGPIDTPSLDRLANEGVELRRFYTTPICSPTRAALMTGRDPMRLGVAYAVIMPWSNVGIHPDEHFMPQSFLEAGYQTAMVGKWHLGHAQQTYHPNQRGFEHFYGHLHTEVGYFPPFANQGGKDFQRNGESISDEGYESYLLADEAARWIRSRDTEKPFFLYMPFIAPHTPLDAPPDLVEKYKDLEDDRQPARSFNTDQTRRLSRLMLRESARPMYAAVVEGMDRAIGKVLDTLDELALAENTIVLFLSDNGGAAYAMGGADNVPLRGGKGETFEGGIRVVASLRWPAEIEGNSRAEQIMSVMDVFPTLAAAVGIEPRNKRKLDGRNMWSAIKADKKVPLERPLFFVSETPIRGSFHVTAFDEEWKLVQRIEQDQVTVEITNHLFRIEDDPYELHNLAVENPEIVQKYAEKIRNWRALYPVAGTRSTLVPPPGWRAPLDWVGYPQPINELQSDPATGMPPPGTERALDRMHGERGRLIYDCEPKWWLAGVCL